MLKAYEHYFGEYPFKKDGYKLIQVPLFWEWSIRVPSPTAIFSRTAI